MEKEKILDGLHMLKEAYEDVIFDFAQAVHSGEESLCDERTACFARELTSGFKSTLIDIGMLEESSGSYKSSWDEGSMRGGSMSMRGMRGGSRDEGSTRQMRSRTTGRYMRSYGNEPEGMNLKEMLQEKINRTPDPQTRMDMQRLMDSLADAM